MLTRESLGVSGGQVMFTRESLGVSGGQIMLTRESLGVSGGQIMLTRESLGVRCLGKKLQNCKTRLNEQPRQKPGSFHTQKKSTQDSTGIVKCTLCLVVFLSPPGHVVAMPLGRLLRQLLCVALPQVPVLRAERVQLLRESGELLRQVLGSHFKAINMKLNHIWTECRSVYTYMRLHAYVQYVVDPYHLRIYTHISQSYIDECIYLHIA